MGKAVALRPPNQSGGKTIHDVMAVICYELKTVSSAGAIMLVLSVYLVKACVNSVGAKFLRLCWKYRQEMEACGSKLCTAWVQGEIDISFYFNLGFL